MTGALFALPISTRSTRVSEGLLYFKSDITDMTSYNYEISVIYQKQNMSYIVNDSFHWFGDKWEDLL